MTAKEMFEELGYELAPTKGTVVTYYNHNADRIKFFNKRQVFSTYYKEYPLDVLKAIYQQCRELGWIDDKETPTKPNLWGDGYVDGELVLDSWDCPNCGTTYEVGYDDYDYCPKCGQHIDKNWSDEG